MQPNNSSCECNWLKINTPEEKVWINDSLRDSQERHFIAGDSSSKSTQELLEKALDGRHVDLLFIDGDHSYKGVKQDFCTYSHFVKEGGLVVFHDIVDHTEVPSVGVLKLWKEIVRHNESLKIHEFIELEDDRGWGPWGGIGVIEVKKLSNLKSIIYPSTLIFSKIAKA